MEQVALREATNKVAIVGVLKEKVLEVKAGDKGRYISGYIIIQTDDNSAHRVNVFASEKTKEGKDSGLYKGFVTINSTYVSLADCSQNNWDVSTATKVSVDNGRLGLNEYYDDNGELHSSWSVSASFVNRARELEYKPKAEFEVEGFITAVRENDDKVYVDMVVPLYGGRVAPMSFSTTSKAGAFISDSFKRGDSVNFRGELVNVADRKTELKQGFGEAREEITIKYVRALVITGGKENPYDPDDETKSWAVKSIKSALVEREAYLATLKDKNAQKGTKTTSSSKTATKGQDFDF